MSLWPPLPAPVGITPMAVDVLVALPELTSAWGRGHWGVSKWGGYSFGVPTPMDCDTQGIDIERGRTDSLAHVSAGGMRLTLQDPDRQWSPWVVPPDGFRSWRTGTPIQIRSPAGHLFTGVVTEIHASEKPEADHQRTVEVIALDPLTFLAVSDGLEQPSQGSNELAGARLERIWANALPPSWVEHVFDAGVARMQPTTLARAALEEAWLTADSDAGMLTCTADGAVRYWDTQRGLTADRRVVPQVTFTDDDDYVPTATTWGPSERIFPDAAPTNVVAAGGDLFTLGPRFTALVAGRVTHLRYRNHDGTAHTLTLWTDAGTKLASLVDPAPAIGWRELPLPVPITLTAGATYVVSHTTDGRAWGFNAGATVSIGDHLANPTGRYEYGTDVFPAATDPDNSYLADVVFQPLVPIPVICTTKFDVVDDQAPVINWVGIAAAGGSEQVATDSASVSFYGRRTTHRHDLVHAEGDAFSASIASTFLTRVTRNAVVVSPLVFDALASPEAWAAAHTLDVADRVAVHRSAAGERLDITAAIDQITHRITPYAWECTVKLAPGTQRTAYTRWGTGRWGVDKWS